MDILNIYMVEHITGKCLFTDVTPFHTQMYEINKCMESVTISFSGPLLVCWEVYPEYHENNKNGQITFYTSWYVVIKTQ